MRNAICGLLLMLVATPSLAGSRACTSGLVTAGVCSSTTDRLLYFTMPAATELALLDALAEMGDWQETVLCTPVHVQAGQCTAGQLGTSIANPQTKAAFAQGQLTRLLNGIVDRHRTRMAEETARDKVSPADIKP